MASLQRRYAVFAFIAACFLFLVYQLRAPSVSRFKAETAYEQKVDTHPGHSSSPKTSSRTKWADIPVRYPVESFRPLPTGKPIKLPKIQHAFTGESKIQKSLRETRREEVKKTFQKCWKSYSEHAWMKDELSPISGDSKDHFGGWAATLIDALDTLFIMGLRTEFEEAVKAVADVDFSTTSSEQINVFETNIRHLGGLLSAYGLSGEKLLLNKAIEVGEMLYVAFDTPNRMPITRWYPQKAMNGQPQVADTHVLVAEIGSLTMEFIRLSQVTGDRKWYDAVARMVDMFEQQQNLTKLPGMWPITINAHDMNLTIDDAFTLGAMSDSLYEYWPKTFALLGGLDPVYKKLYKVSMATAIEHTLFRPMIPDNADILMSGLARPQDGKITLDPQMQHLVCFAGGMFALGGKMFDIEEHVDLGRKLTDGCIWAYKAFPFGIMPEVSHLIPCESRTECKWDESKWKEEVARKSNTADDTDPQANIAGQRLPKGFTAIDDRRYILRPEAIESVFILYRITGAQQFQAAAFDMFTSIQKYTQTDLGNAALSDISVTEGTPPKMDSMESFWLAETLKYFYLIFSEPDLISLDDYVFNTEAHPFPILK